MKKSPDAFRTISEVADWLETPAHVLRFWESRFSQIKPVKRAGGRRYYRPSDMRLLGGIKKLLHDDGVTIRGVQKILREHGIKHVSGFSPEVTPVADDAPRKPTPRRSPDPAPAPSGPAEADETERQSYVAPKPAAVVNNDVPPSGPETTASPVPLAGLAGSAGAAEALDDDRRNEIAVLYGRLKALRDRMTGGPSGE